MTGTQAAEYRELELQSSNLLLEADSRLVLSRYEEAAFHALQAGRSRARMGELNYKADEWAGAAEDWLSAAACFLRATAPQQAQTVLRLVQQLSSEGKIPAHREDVRVAQEERTQELDRLRARARDLQRELDAQGCRPDVAAPKAIPFLVGRVREFPGFWPLHYLLFRQASALGDRALARKHLRWEATFDPDNANFTALLGFMHLADGRPDPAIELGSDFLARSPVSAGSVRVMLANAFAQEGGAGSRERAIEVLRPLLDDGGVDVKQRIAAVALSALFSRELGQEQEFARLLRELEALAGAAPSSGVADVIAEFRRSLPAAPNGQGSSRNGGTYALPEAVRRRLFEGARELTVGPMSLGAGGP